LTQEFQRAKFIDDQQITGGDIAQDAIPPGHHLRVELPLCSHQLGCSARTQLCQPAALVGPQIDQVNGQFAAIFKYGWREHPPDG
jgi:hypothetical protein